jgi:hypothetical protein
MKLSDCMGDLASKGTMEWGMYVIHLYLVKQEKNRLGEINRANASTQPFLFTSIQCYGMTIPSFHRRVVDGSIIISESCIKPWICL